MSETTPSTDPKALGADENQLIAERRDKLKALRERHRAGGAVPFPNDFKPRITRMTCTRRMATKQPRCCRLKARWPEWPVA